MCYRWGSAVLQSVPYVFNPAWTAYLLKVHFCLLATQRRQLGKAPSHLTFRLRHVAHANPYFLAERSFWAFDAGLVASLSLLSPCGIIMVALADESKAGRRWWCGVKWGTVIVGSLNRLVAFTPTVPRPNSTCSTPNPY